MFEKLKRKIKVLNKNVLKVSKKTRIFYLFILIDIIFSIIVFGVSSEEYRIYEFYNINMYKRSTYLTKRRRNIYNYFIRNKNILNILSDKKKFLLRFKSYLKNNINNINDVSFKQYEDFVLTNGCVLFRSKNKKFYESYNIYNNKDFRSPAFLLEEAKKKKCELYENGITNNKKLNEITDNLIVLNIVTLNNRGRCSIVSSNIKFKDKDKVIYGFVDKKTGILKGHLLNENLSYYNNNSYNLEIPYYNDCIELSKKLSYELDEIKEVEWSFCISSKGIYFIDANLWDDYEICQLPEFVNYGLKDFYKKNI